MTNPTGDQDFTSNPIYQEIVGILPEELQETVTPLLQKWDSGVRDQFKDYETWKPIISSGSNVDQVNAALNLLGMAETEPKKVIDALNDYHQLGYTYPAIKKSEDVQDSDTAAMDPWEPRLNFMEQAMRQIASYIVDQKNAQQASQADKALEDELASLRKKHGDFDEPWVMARMHFNGKTGEQAVKEYQQWYEQTVSSHRPKPLFLGANNGGNPGNITDPKKMTDDQAKSTAIQMLMAANAERSR